MESIREFMLWLLRSISKRNLLDETKANAIYPEHSQKIDEIRIMADHRMYEDKTQNRKKG